MAGLERKNGWTLAERRSQGTAWESAGLRCQGSALLQYRNREQLRKRPAVAPEVGTDEAGRRDERPGNWIGRRVGSADRQCALPAQGRT